MAVTDKEKKYPDWWYQSPYQKELDSLAGQIEGRPDFKFKVDQEAIYDYYKGEYDRQGQEAKLDTQAKGAALTGGYGNSYARQAGQRAYDGQMDSLREDVVPDLWQMALDKYTREGKALVDRYETVQKKEKAAYDQWEKEHKDEIEALQRQQEQQNAAASAVDRIVGKNNRNDPMAQYMGQRVDQITAGKTTKDPGQVAKDLSWEGYRTTMDSAIRKVTGHQDLYDGIPKVPQYADSPLYVQKPPTAEELRDGLVPYEALAKVPDFLTQSNYEPKDVGSRLTRQEMEGMSDEEQDRYFDAFNYESSQEDLLYEAVNGNFLAMLALNSNGYEIYEGLDEMYRKTPSELMQMKTQETAIFNYVYKTFGLDAAKGYLNHLASDLSGRQRQAVQEAAASRAQKQPFLSSVDTILTSPLRGQIGTVGVLSDLLEDGKLSANADYNMLDYQANAVRGKVSEMIEKQTPFGKVGSFVYGAGMSIGDSLARMVTSAGNPFLSAELAACGAGVSTISNAKDLGLNDAQALALGVIAGFAEGFFEKHNLEDLLNADLMKDGMAKYILKNATNEATEEVSTELVNTVADIIIGWDKGQMRRAIDAYKAHGLDAGQASLRAFCDKLLEIGEAGAMGFLTGGLMSGTNVALNSIVSTAYKKSGPTQAARQPYTGTDAPAVNTPGTELSGSLQNVETKADSPDAVWDQRVQRYVQGEQAASTATIQETQTVESNTAKAENSSLKAASKKYGAQATMMEDAYQEGQDVERYDREYKLAYDLGKEGASRELLDDGETLIYLTAEQKNTAYQSGAAAAENAGIVTEVVKSLGITGEHAGVLTQSFNANQITAKDYAMGLQEAYEAGKTGIPLAEAGSHAAKLTDAQRQIAYKQGQKASGRQVAKQQAQVRKNRSAEGADTSKGKVHFDGNRSSLNKTQRASMDAMEVLAKTLGVQIYVENFEGTKNANKNGWYDPKDGSIHININAGADGKGTMLFTVAHELTHFIRQWSPAKFRVLANFVTKQYAEKGISIRELIDDQIAKAKEDGRELTDEEALEEVVADSMETMLVDGSIMEMMAEIRQQDHGLWAKIKEWFRDFASKLQSVVDAYKGVQPDSTEGRMVADMKDMIGTLEALYMDALVDASENFDGGVQKITANEGGVKYQARRLSENDLEAYLRAGARRNQNKFEAVENGKQIILTSEQEITDFIANAIDKKAGEVTVAYGKVNDRLASEVSKQSKGKITIDDYYLELIPTNLQHAYEEHSTAKEEGDFALTKSDFEKIPEYLDSFTEVLYAIKYSSGSVRICVSKKLPNGRVLIIETVSKSRGAIQFKNAIGVSEEKYVQKYLPEYKKRAETNARGSESSNISLRDSSNSNISIRNDGENVNKKISDRDSTGNQLSAEQQEYFKDSEARDDGGNLLVLYHQTDGDFTIFDTRHPGAGSRDNGTPFGIFMKRSAGDIGLAGKKQMALYANITNPLRATNREDLTRKLREISERYASISDQHKKLDAEYREKFEQAKKAWVNYITEWRSANPGASRNALNADPKFNELYDAEDNVVDEWTAAADRLSIQAKEVITEDLRKAGYDGVFLAEDVGSWGRKTDAIIALDPEQVKNITNKKPTQNPDIRYSQRDVGRQEAVTQALEKENAKLREDVAELRELVKLQRQVTNGTKFTKTSVEAAARYLKQNANAKGDTKELMKLLSALYEYIASGKELTWEGVKEQAQAAADWLWEHIDRKGKPTDYAQDILKQLHGARVYLDESQMAEAEYRFGSYDVFRKGLMGSITLAKNAETSLDSLWAEMAEIYPDVFDGEISAADMPSALMDIIHRLRSPDTTIDYARNREMMEQDLLREIYDSYWRVSTLYTPADVGARRINKLKSEHYQRMEKLKQDHREAVDRLKQAHQARLEQVRKDHRAKLEEKVERVTKRYQDARKQNVEGRKKTEQRRKIRKTIRELSKLLVHGTKERNVKEGMKDFVSTAIASAEVLFTDEYTNEDMIRNGVQCECEGWESSLIDKTRALIRQRDELLAGATAAREAEDVMVGDLTGYEERMNLVRRLEGKINDNMGRLKGVFARERSRLNKATASSLLNSLAEEYWKLGTADEEYIRGALDENVHQHLLNLSKEIGGTTVKDMSLSQLEQLHRAYTMVLTTVRNANKSFAENLKGTRQEQAQAVVWDLAEAGKKRKKQTKGQIARAKRSWNNLKSVYAFERIGSGTLKQLYENLRGGEDTWMVDMDHAREHFLKAAKNSGYNGWDLNKQVHTFESSTGLEFDLNLGQIMSIYAYARRGQQALDHLMKGGFVFDKYTEERVTEHGIPKTYLKDDATAYNLSLETIQEIIGKLTPEQRTFVEKMQDYLSDTMGGKGNEVSMKLYGVKLFGEKNYFPLRSSGVYLSKAADQEQQKQQGQVSVKNAGFTHSTTPNAANPVVLSGFMDVWANHVNDMSMYHAFVLSMEDFNKVYNYSTPHTEESQSGAVKQAIINAHGSAATDYINQLIRDLNGGVVTDPREGQYKAWISKFKKASVMASASVVIQQPTAIVRALAYIDPKYFGAFSISRGIGRALGNKITGNHTQLYDELKKYAPVAAIKQMGRFDTDMGMGAVDYLTTKEFEGFKEQAKALFTEKGYLGKRFDEITGFMAERADEITWAQIWQAVKNEVADKQRLKFGSEEHLKAAGKRFTEVVTRTQVYDSVFSRSANMRSKGAFMTMATSFMAEPTTTANMLTDAIRKAKKGDVKFFLRVGASVAGAIIFNNILRSAVYAMRDDDEDETFIEKYLQALISGVFDDVNPMSYLPFWRDVWSLAQGYDVERADMSVIATLMDAGLSLAEAMAKDTDGMTEEELETHNEKLKDLGWKFIDGLASAVGLPVKNLRRDIIGAANFFETIQADGDRKTTANSLKDKVWEDFVSSVPGMNIVVDADSRTDDLYDAIVAGDNAYMERLKSGYKSEQSYLQAKRKGLRENDGRIKAAAVARMDGELETYMNIAKEIIAEGNFTQDDVVVAINAVISELTPSGSSSVPKAKGLFDANAFATAISQDDTEMAKLIRADIIRTAQRNGKTEDEAAKSFVSSVTSACKEMFSEGDLSEEQAVSALMNFCDKDRVEARASVAYWDFTMEYPDVRASAGWFETYYKKVENSGVSIEEYVEYRNRKTGYTKRAEVLAIIDGMDLTRKQKDALYRAEGYAESTLEEAPWHK